MAASKQRRKTAKSKKANPGSPDAYTISNGKGTFKFNDVTKVAPVLRESLCYSLNKVGHRMKAHLEKALAPLGISAIHMGVMRLIEAQENVSQNELADTMGMDKATMVKLVDHLQELRALERRQSPDDRRVNFITPTEKGTKLLAEARKHSLRAETEFLSRLKPEEIKILKGLLHGLLD